jgi:fructan beta-fructosidase
VSVSVGGEAVRRFTIELADGEPDWWAFLDVSAWKGKKLTVEVDRLPARSKGLSSIDQGDTLKGAADLYKEALRPQLHFSSRRGWLNDPNGLVYYDGEYHLFYQHNPYGTRWGNMHWGHAVSRDLVRWEERPIALYPDKTGPMFSGSAVVDWKNTSGLGKGGEPPVVLAYTAFGPPAVQCLAYSNDKGKTWAKYAKNPVLKNIAPEDRDPKVIWHAPTKRWVMVLYVGLPRKGGKGVNHTVHFFTSPDLKEWTYRSKVDGFFECPDLFELPLDGDAKKTKWVLTAASSEYMVGTFDGVTFKPQTKKLPGHRGRGFYAAQTFSDIPARDGRRIQIGWGQMPSPGMAFNQMMCFPCELSLVTTADGPRLAWRPVKELEKLRAKSHKVGPVALRPGGADPLAKVKGELVEVRLEAEPSEDAELALTLRGTAIGYDTKKQELRVGDLKAPAPLRGGKLKLIALVDRTSLEVWASDGLTYVPSPVIPKAKDLSLSLAVKKGAVKVTALDVHELRSIWSKP